MLQRTGIIEYQGTAPIPTQIGMRHVPSLKWARNAASEPAPKHSGLDNADEDPMDQLRGHSITYRIAVGPQQGRKVFTLQTLPDERDADEAPAVGKVAGFSLHAGVAAKANQRDRLERLCRYITRPAIAGNGLKSFSVWR